MIVVVCRTCNARLPTGKGWWLVPCPHCGHDPAAPPDDDDEPDEDSDPTGDYVPADPTECE